MVLGFDSFKEWTDDKLNFVYIVKEWVLYPRVKSLPWGENVSLNAF